MKPIFAILTLALGIGAASGAQAMATPHPAGSAGTGIELVSGGCGPEGHRDAYGYCRPNFRRPPPPPAYYRACPPGFHPTPYGCRRNY